MCVYICVKAAAQHHSPPDLWTRNGPTHEAQLALCARREGRMPLMVMAVIWCRAISGHPLLNHGMLGHQDTQDQG